MRTLPALLLVACGSSVDLATTEYPSHPQAPAILRDVAMIDDDVQWVGPYVPGHRTTMDGRVALRVQGGTADIERLSTQLSFFLFAPEKLSEPILPGPAGAGILADAAPFDVEFPPALDPSVTRLGHHAICDPTTEFPVEGERPNPYPCGTDNLDDCYDLTVISSTSPTLSATLWGTPATVQVNNPKTTQARIVDVTLGTPVEGITINSSTEFTEPAVTMDGRLLTGRLGRISREWTNPETGETLRRPYDLAYSVLPEEADPCDITAWSDFHPISHAPYDPQMVATYGLAAYPFRDTEGRLIPDGEDMGGTYPWVDREGANLFMTGVHGRLSEQSETAFPRRCANAGCEDFDQQIDFDRGFMVAGLWTQGKLVHLDGQINNIDWSVGVNPQAHWMVDLYEDETGEPVQIRFGSGRFIENFREGGPYPDGYTHNANILDSLQNLPNAHPALQPVTPRDVVWVMSSGVATDEIAFDDLLDPNALIVSNMQPSITQLYNDEGESTSIPHQHNGQVRELGGLGGVLAFYELKVDEYEPVHIQNAATSLGWEVPAYGHIDTGKARTEPVSLGGIEGRGLWLSGDTGVVYEMPTQPSVDEEPAYIGVFVDRRSPAEERRELLSFPDGTAIVLSGQGVLYARNGKVVHEVDLPASDGWVHLGWRVAADRRTVTLYVDGFALDEAALRKPVFSLQGGPLVLGATDTWTGLRGWVDNLVVLAHDVDPEVACNHAKGTLVAVNGDSSLQTQAAGYPDWAHAQVAAAAGEDAGSYACFADYREDYAAHLGNLPEGTRSIRTAVVFPEGPLQAGVPRPDSSDNAFCLSCHTDERLGGLHTDALRYQPELNAEDDPRRQPSQPPRRVFGNIPPGWLAPDEGPGSPQDATVAPPEGLVIDHWVLAPG